MTAKGSILIHVLITSVVISVITAGLLNVMLLQYNLTERAETSTKSKKLNEQAIALFMSEMADNKATVNTICNYVPPGYVIGSGSGGCGCSYAPDNPDDPAIATTSCAGSCKVCACTADAATCAASCTCP